MPEIGRYRFERASARFSQEDWAQNLADGFDWQRDCAWAYCYFLVRNTGALPDASLPAGTARGGIQEHILNHL